MIVDSNSLLEGGFELLEIPRECFLCGERILRFPLFVWDGFNSQLWMHTDCARTFSETIEQDLKNYGK